MKDFRLVSFVLGALLTISVSAYGFSGGHGNNGGSPVSNPSNSNPGSVNCMDHGKTLTVMNDQALQWKASKASGFQSRALIQGTVDEVFSDQTGHRHFSVKIGTHNDDHIEVIYNESFGAMPLPHTGDNAEACGDFIVATQQNGGYPPSPDGALVHWVHKNPNRGRHDSGFVVLNGVLYGY